MLSIRDAGQMAAMRNLITDVAGRPGRPCRRRQLGLRRDRHRVRRAGGGRGRCARRRPGHARDRTARSGDRPSSASTRSRCRAARPSGSMPPPACRLAARAGPRLCGRRARVPIVPGAILFDLLNGGDKNWGRFPPYRELGYAAAAAAGARFRSRQRRRRLRRDHRQSQGRPRLGLGATRATASPSARSSRSMRSAASTIGDGPHFWAAPFEQDEEFGGRGWPAPLPRGRARAAHQGRPRREHHHRGGRNRRDADQGAGQAARRHGADGFARAIYPVHTPLDGDIVFAAATGRKPLRRSAARVRRARHARRQCARPRHRARRLRGDRAALPRRAAVLARPFRNIG